MPKAPYTLEKLIKGYRAKIDRAERRAEQITLSPNNLKMLLDAVEARERNYESLERLREFIQTQGDLR